MRKLVVALGFLCVLACSSEESSGGDGDSDAGGSANGGRSPSGGAAGSGGAGATTGGALTGGTNTAGSGGTNTGGSGGTAGAGLSGAAGAAGAAGGQSGAGGNAGTAGSSTGAWTCDTAVNGQCGCGRTGNGPLTECVGYPCCIYYVPEGIETCICINDGTDCDRYAMLFEGQRLTTCPP